MTNLTDVITPNGVFTQELREELVDALEIVVTVQPEDALRVLHQRVPVVDSTRHALRCAIHDAVDVAIADLGIEPEVMR